MNIDRQSDRQADRQKGGKKCFNSTCKHVKRELMDNSLTPALGRKIVQPAIRSKVDDKFAFPNCLNAKVKQTHTNTHTYTHAHNEIKVFFF